jgi:hypothetical protein
MEGQDQKAERDFESYKLLLNLWAKENPIKTTKLQWLLAVNGLLASALVLAGDGLIPDRWLLYAAGVAFNAIWTVSLGRTALFQQAWQAKLRELRDRYPDDPRFSILETAAYRARAPLIVRIFGGVPSSWYLVLSPVIFAMIWLILGIATITARL